MTSLADTEVGCAEPIPFYEMFEEETPADIRDTIAGFLNLCFARSLLEESLDRQLRSAAGITLAQHEVLYRLSLAPGGRLRMATLADLLLASKSGASRLVDRMAGAGLVDRQSSDTDRRLVFAVLTPTGTACEDAWITTASLLGDTERLRFLVAFRPGLVSPTLSAQMAGTFQRLSKGRLLLNVVTGGDAEEQRRFGDWLDHDARYDRTDEFLTVLRGAWGDTPFDFSGRHYEVAGATVSAPPDPVPPVFFGGASPAAERVAARHADVYLAWGEPPSMVAERVDRVSAGAAALGRSIGFGIRLHVIARDTAD